MRCAFHPAREAACRCPACSSFFCRECVTEYGERFLCAACIRTISLQEATQSRPAGNLMARLRTAVLGVAAFLSAWAFYYFAGALVAHLARGTAK